jgi:hypothetical protein
MKSFDGVGKKQWAEGLISRMIMHADIVPSKVVKLQEPQILVNLNHPDGPFCT